MRHPPPVLFALSLVVVSATTAEARPATATQDEGGATFAEVAEELKGLADKAFAEKRWHDAVEAYGRLVGHLLEGGYGEAGGSVAAFHLRMAVAFKNEGDFAAAQTMLLHLAESAPEYEATRRQALLEEVRAALGLAGRRLPQPDGQLPAAPLGARMELDSGDRHGDG
jgi:hypothetical protein